MSTARSLKAWLGSASLAVAQHCAQQWPWSTAAGIVFALATLLFFGLPGGDSSSKPYVVFTAYGPPTIELRDTVRFFTDGKRFELKLFFNTPFTPEELQRRITSGQSAASDVIYGDPHPTVRIIVGEADYCTRGAPGQVSAQRLVQVGSYDSTFSNGPTMRMTVYEVTLNVADEIHCIVKVQPLEVSDVSRQVTLIRHVSAPQGLIAGLRQSLAESFSFEQPLVRDVQIVGGTIHLSPFRPPVVTLDGDIKSAYVQDSDGEWFFKGSATISWTDRSKEVEHDLILLIVGALYGLAAALLIEFFRPLLQKQ